MHSKKSSPKQERYDTVTRFLKNGQSHTSWYKENVITSATLYRWRKEYNMHHQKVCFVPLTSKETRTINKSLNKDIKKEASDILIQLGFCNRQRNRIKLLVWEDNGFWIH